MNVIQELAVRIKATLDYSKLRRDSQKLYKEFDEAVKIPADIVVSKNSKNVIDNYIDQTNSSIKNSAGDAAGDISGAGKDFGITVSKEAYTIAQILREALQSIGKSLRLSADLLLKAFAGSSDAREAINNAGYVTNDKDGHAVKINPYEWLESEELVGLIGVIGNALYASAKALDKFEVSTESASKALDKNTSKVSSKGIKDYGSAGRTILDQLMSGMGINPSVAVMAKAGTAIGILVGLIRRILQKNEALQQATEGFIQALSDLLSPVVKIVTWVINALTSFINAVIKLLGIEVEATEDVANNTRSLAGFDTINNLSSSSSSKDTNKEELDKDVLRVATLIALIIASIVAAITGGASAIIALIVVGALWIAENWEIITQQIVGLIQVIVNTVAVVVNSIVAIIVSVVEIITAAIGAIVAAVAGFFTGIISGFGNFFTTLFNGIKNGENLLLVLWNSIKAFFSGFATKFGETFTKVWGFFKEKFVDPITKFATHLYEDFIKPPLQSILNGLGKIVNGFVGAVNSIIRGINNIFGTKLGTMSTWSVPKLAVGTNYVARDGLAYLHAGEAVVPKAFNSGEFFGGNDEVVSVLMDIKNVVQSKEFKAYISKNDVGQAAVGYINQQSRILGGSLV